MANTRAIRAALIRKLLEGGHRLRVEHILERLTDVERCALLQDLPDRDARSVTAILLGGSGEAADRLRCLHPSVVAAAVVRLDADWAAAVLRGLTPEQCDAVLASVPAADAARLRAALTTPPQGPRVRWPWRRAATREAGVVGLLLAVALFLL